MRPGFVIALVTLLGCSDIPIDRCRDTVCALGQSCDSETGQCQGGDLCAAVLCTAGASCDPTDGQCKGADDDRCRAVTCGEKQRCDPGTGSCRDNPPPPMLSPLVIDRVGRPGISNLFLNPFGLYKLNAMDLMPEATTVSQDKYNAAAVPAAWASTFAPYLRFNLGIFDALDGICGNQYLAGALGPNRYAGLANLLALDVLHVNTASIACSAYLAVEAGAGDCGGWRPGYDIIDTTYTLLLTGTVITPVGDGVATSTPISDVFPFLPALE